SPSLLGSYNATQGWHFQSSYTSFGGGGNYVRFGMYVLNNTGGTDTKNRTGQAKLSLQFKPQFGRTVAGGPSKVNSRGSTSDGAFHVLTGVVPTAGFDEIRRTLVLATTSGDISLQAAYQLTNTPDDETTWDTPVVFGTTMTSEGIGFGTTYTGVSMGKK